MRLHAFLNRLDKLGQTVRSKRLLKALLAHRVLAGAEHRYVLSEDLRTVVDIGANRGQFTLAVRNWAPAASVLSFEPLSGPADVFRAVFAGDAQVVFHQMAIGPKRDRLQMHVSAKDDSSSLLPITTVQTTLFPGTGKVSTAEVRIAPLSDFVSAAGLDAPAMLKLDVQGYEYEALQGCESLLTCFDSIYCECSFVEFYGGQKMAREIVTWLDAKGFGLKGIYNLTHDQDGQAIQADFWFTRK